VVPGCTCVSTWNLKYGWSVLAGLRAAGSTSDTCGNATASARPSLAHLVHENAHSSIDDHSDREAPHVHCNVTRNASCILARLHINARVQSCSNDGSSNAAC
jgi:hypothetical protein